MKISFAMTKGILAALVLIVSSLPALAEKKLDLTYVKNSSRSISKSAMTLTESPKHEVSQEVLFQVSKYSSSEFQPTEEWIYIQTDEVDGTGTHKGYFTEVHKGGDLTYGWFDGTHKTVINGDGSWLTSWEGTYKYLGGTGKFRNIKGAGAYKGKVGAKEAYHEEGRLQIEF
jgi:hypothetical protein